MFLFTKRMGNKAVELTAFHKVRNYQDGVTFCQCEINLDLYKDDHNPKFTIHLIFFNYTIIEFNWYDIRHVEGRI